MVGQLSIGAVTSVLSTRALLLVAFAGSGALTMLFGTLSSAGPMTLAWGLNGALQACVNPLLVLYIAEVKGRS